MTFKAWPLLLVFLLSACSHTVEYQRPDLPVAPAWPPGLDLQGKEEAVKTHWRAYFLDPRLHALIEAALRNNRDMRIATARVLEARAQYGIVNADRFPTLNLVGSESAGSTPADLSGSGSAVNGQRFDFGVSNVSYELDFWGRVASLNEAARNTYLATEEAKRAFQLSLISDVAMTYFSLLQYDELLQFSHATVESREMSLSVVDKGRDLGGSGDFEYLQAEGALESARSEAAALEQQRSVALNKLNFLVGEAPQDLPPGRALNAQGLDAALAPGLPAEVLLSRPDVISAEQHLIAAHANVDAARAAFLPKVALTASLGVASQGLASLFNGMAWTFQPNIGFPLFDGGRLAASRDLAEVRKVIAVAEYEKTIQMAFREVSDLLSARTVLARQLRSAKLNEQSVKRRLEISTARHQVGLVNVLEVLDGERNLIAAQQTTVQLQRAQLDAAAQLYKALGGGT